MKKMTSEHSIKSTDKQRIIFLIRDEVELLDLAGPTQVFDVAARLLAPYSLHFCAGNTQVRSAQALFLGQLEPLPTPSSSDLVIVPGSLLDGREGDAPSLEPDTRNWLAGAHATGAHIASVCAGAFALGEAGLLNGRRCTTHWTFIERLQQRYPTARVVDAVLYACDRGVTTSAGITSGIDMALCIVEKQHGPRLAAEVARWLVLYLRRNGANSQLSPYLEFRSHLHPAIHQVQDWLAEHVTSPASLADLAAVANMSVRNFSRSFKIATGVTPLQYQQRLRLEVAANLLANSDLSIEAVAARCGFEDARHFRRLWHRHFGSPPSFARKEQTARTVASVAEIPAIANPQKKMA